MSFEVRDGGVGGGGTLHSPSNLHWKKEMTQIRKAARVLRDPGTTSSWWSPAPSPALATTARSPTEHHIKSGGVEGNVIASSSDQILQVGTSSSCDNGNNASNKGNPNGEKERRRVYLYNWRNQKSEGEMGRMVGEDDVENGEGEGSSSTQGESFEIDGLNDVRNGGRNDSKSDGYFSDRFTAAMFKCMDSSFTPSIGGKRKKKSKRSNYSTPSSGHRKENAKMKMLLSRYTKNAGDDSPGVRFGRDELLSLIDQSDDYGDYCNSEDLGRDSAISHFLARLKSKGRSGPSSKMLRSRRKEDDSVSHSTQALSTSSYKRYARTAESWDGTAGSLNDGDGDDEVDDQLNFPGRQGCGIPCCWSRRSTPKSRNGCSCSPSFSDVLRRKGSSLFSVSQTMSRRSHHRISLGANKRRLSSKTWARTLIPLLDNSAHGLRGSSMRSRDSDDELSANFSELDLEALSRLVGRRWSSSCRSQDGLELVALSGEVRKDGSPENIKSLSHKYRPVFFEELIGQNVVVQSLMISVSRGRIAPVYLFQGLRGVGKTSMARIFAAAMNCLATEDSKPCGVCRECADFISGKSRFLEEIHGSNKKGVDQLKNLFRNMSVVHPSSPPHYKVIVIDQCHLLPSKTWLAFLRHLGKPSPFVVFILITTDIDNVPRAILTRCQTHIFNKIGNGDIVTRLRKISMDENLDVESNALELIASNADGSLRDAETMLDQLSLFGKQITKSLVNELMGVVSEDKLLELLELAMSSNATETVRVSREVMDSGVDPLVLISQLVTLIVDIIAGTYESVDANHNGSFFGGRTLTERELDRLKHALTRLSEAEKHLRVSSERSTWFTATLLQLGSMPSPDRTQSPFADHCNSTKENKLAGLTPKTNQNQSIDDESLNVSHDDYASRRTPLTCVDSEMLNSIWLLCIEKCHSKTVRLLLHSYGKLVSISEMKGRFIAEIAFEDRNMKSRAECFLSSITNSFEVVLRRNVDVKISLLQDSLDDKVISRNPNNLENKSTCSNATWGISDLDVGQDPLKISRASFDVSDVSGGHQKKSMDSVSGNGSISIEDNKSDFPLLRAESIINEQGSETPRMQALEEGTPGSMSHSRPERNQVLPQDAVDNPSKLEATNSPDVPLQHWGDTLSHEMKTLKINNEMAHQKDQIAKNTDHSPISPSLLHNTTSANIFIKDNMGNESVSGAGGCTGIFCWNKRKSQVRGKATKGVSRRAAKKGRFSLFGECA